MATKKPFVDTTKKEAKHLYDLEYPLKVRYHGHGKKRVKETLAPGFMTWCAAMNLLNPTVQV